ncbi:tetratricopeptide repeat protein [Sphingomonas canadensis]|uniref:Tetratricopeptide repeat protein n=1 Tax=Sphingomonas canadensis TaxID=1219257 RepID=A0ABW3H2W5_9SPHN|nr:SPOR domain-containing protein [Sphingomonas canadensis]MCW3835830.1 SPOR domain-containing protein [Sphingomonas canadensis]
MTRPAFLRRAIAVLAAATAFPAAAQTMDGAPATSSTEVVAAPNPDAERLASEMRIIAANPRDLRALLSAAELSGRVGDTPAALAFYSRAEVLDAQNPRIAAGRAVILIKLQRPGEALQLFKEAEARGLPVREYAADRGLAYDLLGAPQFAQRDYQAALAIRPDDETVRRYALSLGITGRTDEAMAQLDPLLRKSDRAAWRARAFILAMNGDVVGAERIAASMMPGNMGTALSPFFRRLAPMGAADRAFAVHFGELRPSQARLADARFAPELPAYAPPAGPAAAPVQVAAASPIPAPAALDPHKGRGRDARGASSGLAAPTSRGGAAPVPAPAPVQVASAAPPLPPPPVYRPVPDAVIDPVPQPVRAAPPPKPANQPAVAGGGRRVPGSLTAVPAPRSDPRPPGPVRAGQEDPVLASIIAGIAVPDEERKLMEATNAPVPGGPAVRPAPAKPAPAVAAAPRPGTPAAAKPTAAKPAATKPGAKPDTSKTKKPDPAKAEPARIWVQIAGGAEVKGLPLTWAALSKKSPAAFKGRSPWTVPFKATNRLLVGPFKSVAEAQAFVNLVKKDGVGGFVFTSEAGQKITKLAAK